jgi:hypothetical protein
MKRALIALVLTTLATSALAQAPAPDPKTKELQPFVGDWKCTGQVFESAFGPAHPEVATVTGKWILGGLWLQIDFKETKTAKAPMPYHGLIFLGFDQELKQFVLGSVDNLGGYETAAGSGWNGDEMSFEGPIHAGGTTLTARDTFTKKGGNEMSHSFAYKEKDGSWKKVEEDHCKRAK